MPSPLFHFSAHRLAIVCILSLVGATMGIHGPTCALAVEHVIHISIDGCNPTFMQEVIDAGKAPTLKRLQDEGAWTDNARTDFTHTVTIPNHTCMITGRPVEQPEGMPDTTHHGYDYNDIPPHGDTLHNAGNPHVDYIASVFDVAHDAGLSTALYAAKDKFVLYDQSYNETTGADGPHGRDKIDTFFIQDDGLPTFSDGMNERFLADMAAKHFNYVFVHYSDTDRVGHVDGWGSGAWRQALATVDGYLADVVHLVETDPELKGRTTIIINTDHGGLGLGHSESELAVNYTIPMIVWGAGVSHGDLYAINADSYKDPGDARPDYTAAEQPIRNGGTGNLALKLLGLGPIPGSLINARQDLRVAFPGDYNLDGAVDGADYTVWRDTLGSTTDLRADGDGNGIVEEADFKFWRDRFGKDKASKAAAAAP
jgi:Type I phosphodiesterase / nucleotide pyrophosphatase